VIQPKQKAPPATQPPVPLKPSGTVAAPRGPAGSGGK
jgi:hypothetical protein